MGTNWKLQRGPCHDRDHIAQYKSMYDLAVGMSWRVWNARGAQQYWWGSDMYLGGIYDSWMRCVANNDDGKDGLVGVKWVEEHGGDEPPSQQDFINAVHQHPDKSALDKLKGW